MPSLEVLIAAMNQKDADLYYKMGLKTNAVIANQTNDHWYKEYILDDNVIKVISTSNRGVGKNRNIALLNSSADICLLSDDDCVYSPDYPQIIVKAFEDLPNADLIIFNVRNLKINNYIIKKIKKVHWFNFSKYGAPRIAFKRESLCKANVWFTTLFGGGARYSSGEDSIFLRECLKKGLQIYTYPQEITSVKQEGSTWFRGYDEKFFFDKGVLMSNLFPRLKYLAGIYIAHRFRHRSGFSYFQALNLTMRGVIAFKDGVSYNAWKKEAVDSK